MAQCLRLGGLIDLTEFDFRVYGIDKKPILTPGLSWFADWMNACHEAVYRNGGEPDAANHLHRGYLKIPHLKMSSIGSSGFNPHLGERVTMQRQFGKTALPRCSAMTYW